MERKRKLFLAKTAVVMGAIPLAIWAHLGGPDVGKSGVPGESTCAESGCHTGTGLNLGGGSVSVTLPNGFIYTPGVKQHVIVTVQDPSARKWGFQLTARLLSDTKTMAGTFASTDHNTAVVCGASPTDPGQVFLDFGQSQTCPASKPYTYIEHTETGASRASPSRQTFEFDWTPPAGNVGDITLYVAGNGANNDQQPTGDHIYTNFFPVTRAAAGIPTIDTDGVQNGASFQPGMVPNSWITIKGTNLASLIDTWDKSIVGGKLPTSLDGVTVSVGGKLAYIEYVSPTQINAIAPDVGGGTMTVAVTNEVGTSASFTTTSNVLMPAFFLWPGNQAIATRLDFTLAVKAGTFPGVTTAIPAKPGDVLILWGTGFGPANPAAPVGQQVPSDGKTYSTASPVTVTIGGAPATVFGAALSPGFAGLYQVAVQVPSNAPNGDLPIVATVGGAQSPNGVVVTVQR